MRRVNPFFLAFSLLGLGCGPVLFPSETITEFAPFVVRANQAPDRASLLATGTDHLDPQSLPNPDAATLGQLLDHQPGVAASYFGAAANRPILRGLGGRRVGIFQSGMGTGDFSASSPDHAVAIEPLFIRQATLLKGSAALLYGGEAIGGAVDVQPDYRPGRQHTNQSEWQSGLHYGSAANSRTAHLHGGHGGRQWAFRLHALNRRQDDLRIPGFARTPDYDVNNRLRLPPEVQGQVAPNPFGTVPNTFAQTDAFALGAAYFPENRSVSLTYQNYQSRYGVPLDGHTHGNPPGVPVVIGPSPADGIEIDLRQHHVAFQYETPLQSFLPGQLQIKGAVADFSQQEWEGAFLSNDFWRQTREAHLLHRFSRKAWKAYFGLAAVHRNYRNRNITYTTGRPAADRLRTRAHHAAVFSLQEYTAGPWTARLGWRSQWQSATRTDRANLGRHHAAHSLTSEIEYRPVEAVTFLLGSHIAHRSPTPEELFIEAPHGATSVFSLPDPNLRNERSRGAELTVILQHNPFQLRMAVYHRRFDGYIFQQNQGYEIDGLTAYAFVQQDARFTGAEWEASATFWRTEQQRASLHVFADWMHADRLPEKQPLPRIPPARLGSRLQFSHADWQAGLSVLHAFSQDRVPPAVFGTLRYQSPTPAHTIVSVHLSRSFSLFGFPAEAGLNIENLFDEEARQHTSFLKDVAPLPGRDVRLSIEIAF